MTLLFRLAAAVPILLAAASASAQEPDYRARAWAVSCAACHGTGGSAQTGIPAIAGQDRTVLLHKLLSFKAGTLPATVMHQHAKGYTDAELERLADFFSRQPR